MADSSSSMEEDNWHTEDEDDILDHGDTSLHDDTVIEDGSIDEDDGDDASDTNMETNGDMPIDGDDDDASDINMETDGDKDEDDGDVSNFVRRILGGTDSSHDYYGESDLETAEDSRESQSLNQSEVTTDGHNEYASNLEGGNDIGRPSDNRDLYWNIMEQTFVSEAAAYVFYNAYAREHGFSIRKSKTKFSKGPVKILRRRIFVCSREGKRDSKLLTMEGRKYRLRPESRCNCKAQLTVKRDRSSGVWRVARFNDNHSHVLARPDEVPFLWSHRRIKDFQRAEILAMAAAGIRKHIIMSSFIRKYGRYSLVGFTRKDLYNLCSREKRKLLSDGDAATALGLMQSRKNSNPDFFFEYQVGKKGRLKSMFWCDARSRLDYQDFGDVVVFDSTYKMNKYGMPFVPFVGINSHRKTMLTSQTICFDRCLVG